VNKNISTLLQVFSFLTILSILLSLGVSYYIYDRSDLYQFDWLEKNKRNSLLNIHAGFDETSNIIRKNNPLSEITICDFYDPLKHTEVSIKRARKQFPNPEETVQVSTDKLPFEKESFDQVYLLFSAHEIRNFNEKILFFREVKRILKKKGQVHITEHLRDFPNFIAYNIGFLHFHSKKNWVKTFSEAGFTIVRETKHTPFISNFILEHHDHSS